MEGTESKGMGRREFIGAAAAALFAGVAITVTGCGEDEPAGPVPAGDKAGTVEAAGGHSHSVKITKAQIDAGGAVTLTLTGNGHEHLLHLTSDDVAAIKAGTGVHGKPSEPANGHSHSVHFM